MLSIINAKVKFNESMAKQHSYWVLRWKQWRRSRHLLSSYELVQQPLSLNIR